MKRFRSLLPLLSLLVLAAGTVAAQESHPRYQNLKVLPKDIDSQTLIATMGGFTRALGVRCDYCHALTPERRPEDFAKDEKPAKEKARLMMRMTHELNENWLAKLDARAQPAIEVGCFTCHHGVAQPRTLQSQLEIAYATGGLDSATARYSALRERYYGRAAYDFGEVPLVDFATAVRDSGHSADALKVLELNVQQNPASAFAKRTYAQNAMLFAFSTLGPDSGVAAFQSMRARLGADAIGGAALGSIGQLLAQRGKKPEAIGALKIANAEQPTSAGFDALGDAFSKSGDRKSAIASYQRAVEADSSDTHAHEQLKALHAKPAAKRKTK